MFNHERQIQVCMYALIYIYTDTIPDEEFFQNKFFVVDNNQRSSTIGSFPKHWLGLIKFVQRS